PRRDPGARQGGDAVRTGAAAARAGGAARADLPPGGGRMSAAAPRVTIVKVAEWAVARADGVIVTLGLGSCVAIMLHDPEARAGGEKGCSVRFHVAAGRVEIRSVGADAVVI